MTKLKAMIILVLSSLSIIGYSQVVSSINTASSVISTSTVNAHSLSYEIVEAETNVKLESIDYSASAQKLALDTVEEVQSISVYKDGEVYLKFMPVFSKNLILSMKNYEEGDYEVHLAIAGNSVPTIIEITKS